MLYLSHTLSPIPLSRPNAAWFCRLTINPSEGGRSCAFAKQKNKDVSLQCRLASLCVCCFRFDIRKISHFSLPHFPPFLKSTRADNSINPSTLFSRRHTIPYHTIPYPKPTLKMRAFYSGCGRWNPQVRTMSLHRRRRRRRVCNCQRVRWLPDESPPSSYCCCWRGGCLSRCRLRLVSRAITSGLALLLPAAVPLGGGGS